MATDIAPHPIEERGPLIEERGPNGGPVRIRRNGDKVERPPRERWDLILRRGVPSIVKAERELREQARWVQWRMGQIGGTAVVPTLRQRARDQAVAARIAEKYDGLVDPESEYVDFDLGMIVGKLSALRWVLGYALGNCDTAASVSAELHPHRSDKEIHGAIEECFEQVWWNRWGPQGYVTRQKKDRRPPPQPVEVSSAPPQSPRASTVGRHYLDEVARIEAKYGAENLQWGDFSWGQLNGMFSALRWVIGHDWDFLGL